ncbi:MAG: MBL fold metallo-hydrolase [Candidatus Rokuibacteriota bacterium]
MRARALLLVAALTLTACSGTIPQFDVPLATPPDGPHVELHYLGSGGWLFRRGSDAIATAPFVSNPTWFALLRPARPDTALIDEVVPEMPDVEIVLVGHAHYDHAMDLPHVAEKKARTAVFYGGKTVTNVLAAKIRGERLRAVDGHGIAAAGDAKGTWFFNQGRTIRFMPLRSTHAPHFAGLKLVATGTVEETQTELPGAPRSWKEGETLAFVIDFLGPGGRVDFRIYYQDAASEPGTGILPVLEGPDAARTDVAILCVAAFDQVDGNPEHVLANVQPRHVIGGHWEDFFFRAFKDPLRPAFGTSLEDFQRRARAVSSGPVYLPEPRAKLYISIDARR